MIPARVGKRSLSDSWIRNFWETGKLESDIKILDTTTNVQVVELDNWKVHFGSLFPSVRIWVSTFIWNTCRATLSGRVHPLSPSPTCAFDPDSHADIKKTRCNNVFHYNPQNTSVSFTET